MMRRFRVQKSELLARFCNSTMAGRNRPLVRRFWHEIFQLEDPQKSLQVHERWTSPYSPSGSVCPARSNPERIFFAAARSVPEDSQVSGCISTTNPTSPRFLDSVLAEPASADISSPSISTKIQSGVQSQRSQYSSIVAI